MRRVIALVVLVSLAFGVVAIGQGSAVQTCSVQAFFVSPHVDGVIESELITLIEHATSTIDIALYSFTDNDLGDAVKKAARRKVNVRVLLDSTQEKANGGEYTRSLQEDKRIKVVIEHVTGYMHHKFAVIDGQIVVTGSYNWSDNADKNNFENVVVIESQGIAAVFTSEFNRLWSTLQAGGIP